MMKELNLLPYSLKEKRTKAYGIRKYIAYAVIILCFLSLGIYIPNIHLSKIKAEEKSLQDIVDKNKYIIDESKKIDEDIQSANRYIQGIDNISNQKNIVSAKIRDFQGFMPKDLAFTSFTYNKDGVTINGSSSSYNSISEFVANLQVSKKYKSARIVNISNSSDKAYTFSVNIVY